MLLASLRPGSAPRDSQPALQRAATLVVVVLLHVLLIWMLLRLATPLPPRLERPTPITVDLIPGAENPPTATRAEKAERAPAGSPPPRAAAPTAPKPPEAPVDPPPPPPPLPSRPSIWSQVIPMTRQEMAQADISRFPTRTAAADGAAKSGAAAGAETGDTAELGKGPNGERLYNADWYRRPTRTELGSYLPSGGPKTGWGMIACRTVSGYRVEDCQEIAESPAGSGFAGAVRQAAWQFRVLPPRIGGRPLVGAWVRIRIEYTASAGD